jgi:hypothetical protein
MDLDGEGMNNRDRIRGLLLRCRRPEGVGGVGVGRRMRRRRSPVGGMGVVRGVRVRVRVVRVGRGIGIMRRVRGVCIRVLGLVVREGDKLSRLYKSRTLNLNTEMFVLFELVDDDQIALWVNWSIAVR